MLDIEELEKAAAKSDESSKEKEEEGDEGEEDWEDQLETDLCEARELLESAMLLMDGLLRLSWGKGRARSGFTAMQEKELEDMVSEIDTFLGQWEKADVVEGNKE